MLSRRKRSITGNKISKFAEVNIKPSKARRIIRRYHFLNNKKRIICNRLGIDTDHPDDEPQQKRTGTFDSTDMEKLLLKVQDKNLSREQLHRCLQYIEAEITNQGGLEEYQRASRIGQSNARGGDSSKLLVSWLRELKYNRGKPMTALEIGSLDSENCISTCGIFNPVTRIDLNESNNSRGILRQDFMERPIPSNDDSRFHLVSCSLVLNFVPTPVLRGQMLKRFHQFLKGPKLLFLVLPLPCINNSRYMDQTYLVKMMAHLGYHLLKHHESKKLYYSLFTLQRQPSPDDKDITFATKKILHDGPKMNNFCIVL
ncbi:hypothetical protein HG536_0G02250 [Torulaspora globosa]|uniref:25S rRNA adenine-N(1) methyltransferase n=1 Tax=Torulaspora globosa TaxID=48254 RepID=A0A7G3ZLI0_9SACH|nr:uncharacterized protein HG536_0G02250 [Torulaspora globosa]QLL34366.1 hypothetical protein HG536_0G02250 [Torulaspora globosa]